MSLDGVGRAVEGRWRQLAAGSTNRRIFSAAVIVAGLNLAIALMSMVKELLIAASFGTSDALDAFLIASLLPTLVMSVVAGSFGSALIPTYVQVRDREGQTAAQQLLSGIMVLGVGLLVVMAILLALAGPFILPLLGSGFGVEKLLLTQRLFYLLIPITIINGLAMIWSAVLNAGERFALAAFTPIMVPLAAAAALLVGGATWGVYALAYGTVAGFTLQLALLGWALHQQEVSVWPRWCGVNSTMRQVIGQYLPMIVGSTLMSSTLLVDQAMAATLSPGSVAALSYGNKVVALLAGISTAALGTAIFPYFSRMVAAADWVGVRHTLKTYSRFALVVTIPPTFFFYLFSGLLVQVLFQRGAFTETDTFVVARVQAMYVLQIPFYTVGILFVRLISSLQANHILMWGTLVNFITNILLDYLLIRIMGVAGIALATTLVYIVSLIFLSALLYLTLRSRSQPT